MHAYIHEFVSEDAKDPAVGVNVSSLMRQALRTVRPLSYWYAHLRSVVHLQRCRIEQSKPFYALAQTQARPVIRSACCGLHPPLRCARTSAFGSIVGAGSVDHMQTNRLASEESPYLLQHQHNPVRSAVFQVPQCSRKPDDALYELHA